jgi:hypothetical protein
MPSPRQNTWQAKDDEFELSVRLLTPSDMGVEIVVFKIYPQSWKKNTV